MRSWIVLTLLSAGLVLAHPAFAAKSQSKERLAKKACLSGDYAKGVGILADLFVETNDPTFLYNQGRCYEQNVRYVEAAERFREYLRKAPNLGSEDKAEVDKHIADCEAAAAKGQPHPSTEPAAPPAATYQPPQTAVATGSYAVSPIPAPQATTLTSTPPPAGTEVEHPWQHTAKWIAAGAAVAFLGFGVIEHATYYGKNSDYNKKDCNADPGGCKSLADSADTAHTLAIVGYGATAVAAGAAITFWLTDSPKAKPAQQAGIGFSCVPALAGVACHGRF
jgi:tetratricopeptide (TPR) repeat protein